MKRNRLASLLLSSMLSISMALTPITGVFVCAAEEAVQAATSEVAAEEEPAKELPEEEDGATDAELPPEEEDGGTDAELPMEEPVDDTAQESVEEETVEAVNGENAVCKDPEAAEPAVTEEPENDNAALEITDDSDAEESFESEGEEEPEKTNDSENAEDAGPSEKDMPEDDDAVFSGMCGDNASWKLVGANNSFMLTISGSGMMYDYDGDMPWKQFSPQITNAVVESGIIGIGAYAFSDCTSLDSVTIPDGVTIIGEGAFKGCTSLKDIILPESITELGKECFDMCGLLRITIPAGTEAIENYAFGHSGTEMEVFFRGTKNQWENIVSGKEIYYKAIQYEQTEEDDITADKSTAVIEQEIAAANDKGLEAKSASALLITPSITMSDYSFTYNGKVLKPTVIVKNGATVLNSSDYSLTFDKGCKDVGSYKVTVVMCGNYKGSQTSSFRILPKGSTITKLTANEEEITIQWKKQKQQTTGYQIQYAADKRFKDNKTITVKGTEKTKRIIRNLTGGKKYFVRIRTYKKNSSGTYYSKWSSTKSIKIKEHKVSFKVSREEMRLSTGKTGKISVSPTGNASLPPLKWKSSNNKVASVNTTGKITAKSVGTATITVTSQNNSKDYKRITVNVVPGATKSVTTTNVSNGIKVKWKKVAGAKGYYVYRNGKKCATIKKRSTITYTDKKATANGKKYTYKIVAYAGSGKSTRSKSSSVYRLTTPEITTIRSDKDAEIKLKWTKNSKSNGYEIYYQHGKKKDHLYWTQLVKGKNRTSYTEKALTNGDVYTVKLRAYKVVGKKKIYSSWSKAKTVRITSLMTGKTKYHYSLEIIGSKYSYVQNAFVVRTNNPDPSTFEFVILDAKGKEVEIINRVSFYDDFETNEDNVACFDDGYVFSFQIEKAGDLSIYIKETLEDKYVGEKQYVGKVTFKDYDKAYKNWINSIVAKTTTPDMTNDQKMVAIANYLCENTVYLKNRNNKVIWLYEDSLVPSYIRGEYDSYSSPAVLTRFGEAIGYPLESMYYDNEPGNSEWAEYHYYAINRASGKKYAFCQFLSSNVYNTAIKKITSVAELKKAYENAMNHKTINQDPFYWQ